MLQTGRVPGGSTVASTMPEGHSVTKEHDPTSGVGNQGDTCKSVYDSHSDSGFLSGSNLLSSSSVDDYSSSSHHPVMSPNRGTTSSDKSRILVTDSCMSAGGMEAHQYHQGSTSNILTSPGCLDSGIDISDQLSSLQLRSGTLSYDDVTAQQHTNTSRDNNSVSSVVAAEVQDGLREDARSSSSDRGGEISRSHVSLLREIFSPDKDGDTQLHVAVIRGFVEVVYQITRLLPHQAFLDLTNNTGRSPLHLAVSSGVPAIVRHLIVCGASPVYRDLRGNTPLHAACQRRDAAMVTNLTKPVTVTEVMAAQLAYAPVHTPGLLAADLNNYQGETCVHVAARAGDKAILQHLTWYGADVNAQEYRSGRTALHLAVEARDPDLIAHLVTSCRASVTVETYARLTPYQLALANGCTGLATQLLDLGAPAQLLPAAFAPALDGDYDDDDEEDEEERRADYVQMSDSLSQMNGWGEVDDVRVGGVPLRAHSQALVPPAVSTAPHTINADLYF